MKMLVLMALLLGTSCNIPPQDPFVAAERALCRNDLLRALAAYDTVPVAHARYSDARAAAGVVEQRMRRCHELILEALMLRSEWRDAEALGALQRASQHWPQQPNLKQWIAATEKRMQSFADRGPSTKPPVVELPVSVMVEVAKIGRPQLPVLLEVGSIGVAALADGPSSAGAVSGQPSMSSSVSLPATGRDPVEVPAVSVPQLMLPEESSNSAMTASQVAVAELTVSDSPALLEPSTATKPSPVKKAKRLPAREDPVVLGLVAVEARLGRGELALAVRDLLELSSRFSEDARVNRRLSRLLHQRALMSYGQGSVAASVTDWRRVLEIDPNNDAVKRLLHRALAESRAEKTN
jgi:hypothetical protein